MDFGLPAASALYTRIGLAYGNPWPRLRKAHKTRSPRRGSQHDDMKESYADYDRFRPGRLHPVEGPTPKLRAATPEAGGQEAQARPRSRLLRTFDRTLLLTEIACTLVVAWLVAQYVYTVFIDTTPHRVTPSNPAGVVSRRPAATATRIAEVAPPLVGTPDAGQALSVPGMPQPSPAPAATATPTVDPALLLPVRLRIPVMFLDSPVHEVTVNLGTWEVSPMQIGHHYGTANPGETGNVALAGHRDINSALFRELDRLKPGDEVFVSNSLREYRYIVKESFIVNPDHTEVMDPTDDKRVTLITCTPIGLATQRLIVTAFLDEQSGQ